MSDSNSLVYAVWTADLSGCYRLSEMHCKPYVEINPNARGFPFDEINRWDIRKVIEKFLAGHICSCSLLVATGHSLAPTCQIHMDNVWVFTMLSCLSFNLQTNFSDHSCLPKFGDE